MNLLKLYKEDQSDRMDPELLSDFDKIAKRDAKRRKIVKEILATKQKLSAKEYFMIAMIYHHGPAIAHSRLAVKFAKEAWVRKYEPARWLVAGATDRLLIKQKKPQKYGTQFFKKNAKSKWVLRPVDPRVTDEERALFNVPPLREVRKRVIEMNRQGLKKS